MTWKIKIKKPLFKTLVFISIILFCVFQENLILAKNLPSLKQILKKIDALYRAESSFALVEMEVVSYYKRKLKLKCWTKGKDKTLIVIIYPNKEKGIATLRIGKKMWNYFPRINRIMRVPPSMMMASWMGSDFTNDDLVKESTLFDDYKGEYILPDSLNSPKYFFIKLTPRKNTLSLWSKIVLVVRKKDLLPVREEYYNEKGELVRVLYFEDIGIIGGRKLPRVLKMVPVKKKGRYTLVKYLKARFNIPIKNSLFSLRSLRNAEKF